MTREIEYLVICIHAYLRHGYLQKCHSAIEDFFHMRFKISHHFFLQIWQPADFIVFHLLCCNFRSHLIKICVR